MFRESNGKRKRVKIIFGGKKEMSSSINTITMQFHETKDEFIFQVLSDFASDKYNVVIEKEELVRAIQLIRMS